MSQLRTEVVDFIKTISTKELSKNNVLKNKVQSFNNYLKNEGEKGRFELSKYLKKELMLKKIEGAVIWKYLLSY